MRGTMVVSTYEEVYTNEVSQLWWRNRNNAKFCTFCGSQITVEMQKEREQLNKSGCPKCGSTNVTFNREKQGELKGKNGTVVVRSTIGLCKDCGYTWSTTNTTQPQKKNKTWLWVLGWIFVFPVPLTILMLRKKDMKPALKYGIIAAAWIVYLIIGLSGNSMIIQLQREIIQKQ